MDRPLVPNPLARGARGAVVAPHHLASAAGAAMLGAGGSAVDAAIATNAALSVVMPNGCGLGGDGFWLIWDEQNRRELALNGSGRAAMAMDVAWVRNLGHRTMPARGPLSITVPGAIRSWSDAHRRFGRLPVAEVLAPAIELARDGFPAWDGFIDAVEATSEIVSETVGSDAGWFEVCRPHGRAWRPGERVRQPALAATLERLAAAGLDDAYEGDLAERQARFLAEMGSPITLVDLRTHTSSWTDPIAVDYRGVRVTTHPPNSSGLVALELLNILERFEPPASGRAAVRSGEAGPALRPSAADTARWVHLGVEAAKLAMADRDACLTDPEFHSIPVDRLLDKVYAGDLAASIDPNRASKPVASRQPRGGGTTYMAAVDREGLAVSLIASNYRGFGSGVLDPATGIGYQNRGSYFSLDPSHPNVLAPGKRTLHTLLPGMVFRDARPWVVTGSMGGDAQPQIYAQIVSDLVDRRSDVATAVALPRWFVEPEDHFAPPDVVRIEPRFGPDVLEALAAMGHRVSPGKPFDSGLGHCHGIELVDGGPAHDGTLAAATDPRSAGLPVVL